MFHEILAAVLPNVGLGRVLKDWGDIAERLSESKRRRVRQHAPLS